jgi:phosphoribosylformylglycinamidine cyclo-ligase
MTKYDVDIDLANETKKEMAELLPKDDSHLLNHVGAFASLYDFSFKKYKNPILVLKTEEPGSKQLLAAQCGKIENVCQDMIHHLINDCIVMGATPLTVQDAIICGKLEKDIVTRIVKTVSDACNANGCVLSGGETSEQPGVLADGTYILTSSIVGIVEKDDIIDGSEIRKGDLVLALESSGIHTNGYTLVRRIIKEHPEIMETVVDGKSFMDSILTPHRCYYNSLKDLFGKNLIHGLAHITGGGIRENLNRILPEDLDAKIDLSKYHVLNIFKQLKQFGDLDDEDMLRTFNLGVGMTLVTSEEKANIVTNHLEEYGVRCHVVGEITYGKRQVICNGRIDWDM